MENHDEVEVLLKKYDGIIRKIVNRYKVSNFDKEDLYQAGQIGLFKAIKNFNSCFNVKLSTYAFKYIIGEVNREYKKLNLYGNVEYNKIRKTMPLEENICYNEDLSCDNKVKIAANKLEKKYKDVFELFYIDDLKVSEISKILEINEPNVRTRLKRAREKVREIILKGERING